MAGHDQQVARGLSCSRTADASPRGDDGATEETEAEADEPEPDEPAPVSRPCFHLLSSQLQQGLPMGIAAVTHDCA